MIKYLIKSVNEFRIETMDDVEEFHKQLQAKAEDEGFTLGSFAWSEKTVKEKGDVVDTYYQVKAQFVFNILRDPEYPLKDIEFNQIKDFTEIEE